MKSSALKITASLLAITVTQFATVAHAVDAVPPANAPATEAPASDVAAPGAEATDAQQAVGAPPTGAFSVIVVTATKRETDLQKTPIAISVVDPQIMQDRHIQSLIDLADGAVPSLRIATFEARQSALTVGIRGIVPFDQNQSARDAGVGVNIDGVYLGRSQGLDAALFDVERIEILRGPQGTLFGRNSEGGALSIVTKQPTGQFEGSLTAGVGNFGSYDTQAHINLPEFANIAIKVNGVIKHQGATVKNPLAGQYGWNYNDDVGGRISAKWSPGGGFTALLAYDRTKDQNTPNYSQLIDYNPLGKTVGQYDPITLKLVAPGSPVGTSTVCGSCIAPLSPLVYVSGGKRQDTAEIGVPQQLSVDRTDGFSATLKYEVADHVELRSITAWRGVTTDQWDNSGGAHRTIFAPNANFSRYSLSYLDQHQFSQEFQAVGSFATVDWVIGAFYFDEHAREKAATPSTNKWNMDGTNYTINSETVAPPITSSNNGWQPASWFVQRDSHAEAKSYAAFGQATWSPIDSLHLTGGLRWTEDKRDGALTIVSGVATPWTFTYKKDRIDPLVTLAWDATQAMNFYAKYSTGYRAGGANDRSSSFAPFGPESVKAFEVGAKTKFFDDHVRLNLAGYMMDRKGTQIDFDNVDTRPFLADGVTPNPTFNLHTENTANAPGTSKIRGFEAELSAHPIDDVTLGVSYSYTHTEIPETPNPNPGPTFGVPTEVFVVYTPKNAVSGFVDFHTAIAGTDMGARVHLDANYADPVHSFQNEDVLTDSSFIVNGSIALTDIPLTSMGSKMTVSLWSRNLLDETHIYRRSNANAGTLGDYANFNPPRTFGVEATANF
jgi:iron complex outermembrane receptor protein